VREHYTYIAENECAGKSEGEKWRDETKTDEWRGERRRLLRGARGELARLARRPRNEDEEMGNTDVKKKNLMKT
jgi:hypothetical protein